MCQINLTAAPVVPAILEDITLLTLFVSPETGALEEESGGHWCLRTYPSLRDLAPLEMPAGAPRLMRGFECRWEECVDHSGSKNVQRTKVGGSASEIQSEPWWDIREHPADPQFCLQIDSEPKVGLAWGDGGMVHLARGTAIGAEGRWFLDWQCY